MEYDRKGYTLRHRKRWDGTYHHRPLLWLLMSWFIDNAVWEDKTIKITGKNPIKLKRGQLIYSERKLAKFFKVGRQRIRSHHRSMILDEFITHQTTQGISVATIVNYDRYQFDNCQANPPSNPRPTHDPTHVPLNNFNKLNKRAGDKSPTETEKKGIADAAKGRIKRTKEYLASLKPTGAAVSVKVDKDLKTELKAKAKDQGVKF